MKYLFSLADQGLGAALSLALSLWLIRGTGAEAYGVYILWFSAALVLNSLQNAITVAHLFPLPPGPEAADERRTTEELLLAVTTLLIAATTLGTALTVWGLRARGSEIGEPAAILFVPGYLTWQYARALAFTRGDAAHAFVQAMAIAVLTVLAIGVEWLSHVPPTAAQGLAITGASYAIVGVAAMIHLARGQRLDLRPARLRRYGVLLSASRWPFLGVLSVEMSSRLYSFFVAGWFGPAALGRLSAAQVMLRPATIFTGAWMPVARANMSGACNTGDSRAFVRGLTRGTLVTMAVTFAWGCVVVLAWPAIDTWLYKGRFADAAGLVMLSTFYFTVSGLVMAVGVAFQALGAFRPLALAELTGAVMTAIGMVALSVEFGYSWCLVGMMIGGLVQIFEMLRLLPLELRRGIAQSVLRRSRASLVG